ncbi:MAG: hypothetical protein Phog2KO_13220 [Phototrophicaceae bacterium]
MALYTKRSIGVCGIDYPLRWQFDYESLFCLSDKVLTSDKSNRAKIIGFITCYSECLSLKI